MVIRSRAFCILWSSLLAGGAVAFGQRIDVTPLIGGRWGGDIKVTQEGVSNRHLTLDDSLSYGVSAGYRFDGSDCEGCDLVAVRWLRQDTHIRDKQNPLGLALRSPATVDHFLGDLAHEFVTEGQNNIRPFVMATMGASRMSTPLESRTRFVFGIGGGVNVFVRPRWGFRFHVEYLPTVMHAEIQKVVCVVACVITANGGVMNQFSMTFGPILRF